MELVGTLVGNIVMFCIAGFFLLGGYSGARCVLRRYKSGLSILGTKEGKNELFGALVCTMIGLVAVWGLVT